MANSAWNALFGSSGAERLKKAQEFLQKNNSSREALSDLFQVLKKDDKKIKIAKNEIKNKGTDNFRFVLSLFDNPASLSVVTVSYLTQDHSDHKVRKEITKEEVIEFLPLVEADKRSAIADSFLVKNEYTIGRPQLRKGLTLQDLEKLLPYVKRDARQATLALSWFATYDEKSHKWQKQEQRTLEELKELLKKFNFDYGLMRPLVEGDSITAQDLRELMPLVNESNRAGIAFSWLANFNCEVRKGRTFEDLKEFLPLVNEPERGRTAFSWLAKSHGSPAQYRINDGITFRDIKEFLPLVAEHDKIKVARSYLAKLNSGEGQDREELTMQDFKALVTMLPPKDRNDIAAEIKSFSNHAFSYEELQELLPLFNDDGQKLVTLPYLATYNSDSQTWKIKEGITLQDLEKFSPLVDQSKIEEIAVSSCITYDANSRKWKIKEGKTIEDVKELLKLTSLNHQNISHKNISALSEAFLGRDLSNIQDLKEFSALFHESNQTNIALAYLAENIGSRNWKLREGRTLQDLKEVLPLVNEHIRGDVALSYFATYDDQSGSWKIKEGKTINNLIGDLKEVTNFLNPNLVKGLLLSYISKTDDLSVKLEAFLKLTKDGVFGDIYSPNTLTNIADTYKRIGLTPELIPDFCRQLYQAESYQDLIFKEVFSKFEKPDLLSSKEILLNFVLDFREDGVVLENFESLRSKLALTNAEQLNLLNGRAKKWYPSLAESTNDKKLSESDITPQGLQTLFNEFGEEFDLTAVNMADLLMYYKINNKSYSFRSLLSPDFVEKLSNNFHATANSPVFTTKEINDLQYVFDHRQFPTSKIPKVEKVSSYLSDALGSKLQEIEKSFTASKANDHQNYQLSDSDNFTKRVCNNPSPELKELYESEKSLLERRKEIVPGNDESTKEKLQKINTDLEKIALETRAKEKSDAAKEKEKFNTKFIEILKTTDQEETDQEELANFFTDLMDVAPAESAKPNQADNSFSINSYNKGKLLESFNQHRSKFSYLLSQENGIDDFLVQIIPSLNDGCVANISNVVSRAVYLSIAEKQSDSLLFQTFITDIAQPILDQGDALGGSANVDFLNIPTVKNNFLSPLGLFNALSQKCFHTQKPNNRGKVMDGEVLISLEDYLGKELERTKGLETNDAKEKATKIYQELYFKLSDHDDEQEEKSNGEYKRVSENDFLLKKFNADLIAYMVIKNTLPEILQHRDLQAVREKFSEFENFISRPSPSPSPDSASKVFHSPDQDQDHDLDLS